MGMAKFRNKYRIETTRLKNWDYGRNGAYFITICTQNREHYFGEMVGSQFIPSKIGQLAEKFWLEIPEHYPFVELGNFVVMPNHTHGILIINKMGDDAPSPAGMVNTPNLGVSGVSDASGASPASNGGPNPKWKPGTIGSIINQYKRIVTIHALKIDPDFAWQARFYDHIIRNSESFERIQTYIENNPMQWYADKFYGKKRGR